jgi:hypothetical protein
MGQYNRGRGKILGIILQFMGFPFLHIKQFLDCKPWNDWILKAIVLTYLTDSHLQLQQKTQVVLDSETKEGGVPFAMSNWQILREKLEDP